MPVQPRPTVLPGPPGVRAVLGRALALRCPRCGVGALWARAFTMHERCPACGLQYEREQGYFVGAIYLNYAVTVGIAVGGVLALDAALDLSFRQELVLALGLVVLVPIAFFRYARSLWLGLDYLLTAADERLEYRRARRR